MKDSLALDLSGDLIEQYGLCKHMLACTKKGKAVESDSPDAVAFCAVGAIERVCGGTASRRMMIYALRGAGYSADEHSYSLILWNNTPERTQADVSAALWKAADLARAEGL